MSNGLPPNRSFAPDDDAAILRPVERLRRGLVGMHEACILLPQMPYDSGRRRVKVLP